MTLIAARLSMFSEFCGRQHSAHIEARAEPGTLDRFEVPAEDVKVVGS